MVGKPRAPDHEVMASAAATHDLNFGRPTGGTAVSMEYVQVDGEQGLTLSRPFVPAALRIPATPGRFPRRRSPATGWNHGVYPTAIFLEVAH